MFKFLPTPALPGFRVGLADDDTPGFNVPSDGSTPPVLLAFRYVIGVVECPHRNGEPDECQDA